MCDLQGLNVVHPESPPSDLTDAQNLLSAPLFPDFASNDLDLWSNISFASDEPFVSARDRELEPIAKGSQVAAEGSKDVTRSFAPAPAQVVPAQQEPEFDFGSFLAQFGLNPPEPQPPQFALPAPPVPAPTAAPASVSAPPVQSPISTTPSTPRTTPAPSKRARTSKTPTPDTTASQADLTTPLTPAEDKRRRNTAASARFRLKKKEREAALDARAHALEDRVTELERECEALRRENGWLRGLVVGVTGGVVPAMNDVPVGPADKPKRDEEAT